MNLHEAIQWLDATDDYAWPVIKDYIAGLEAHVRQRPTYLVPAAQAEERKDDKYVENVPTENRSQDE